jgi:hypothetical protein
MKLDVLSAVDLIAEPLGIDNTYYNQELLCEVWFLS